MKNFQRRKTNEHSWVFLFFAAGAFIIIGLVRNEDWWFLLAALSVFIAAGRLFWTVRKSVKS
ncbi:MAG: hypothetical protein ABIG93_04480 [archaeon]|nr:hypothetical protein [Nanoarchaeota archaeon]